MIIPRRSEPTHPTAGLDGYPARDWFGKPGEAVWLADTGIVTRLSGHDPKQGGTPGGAYGWSIYVACGDGSVWFLTHFGSRLVKVGQLVCPHTKLGTIADSAISGKPGTSHIHAGRHAPRS